MKKVFILQHVRKINENLEDIKFIGVYSSKEKAKDTINRLKFKRGFRKYKDAFYIDKYQIDKDNWTDGFGV
jgi:hypothetical protein